MGLSRLDIIDINNTQNESIEFGRKSGDKVLERVSEEVLLPTSRAQMEQG